MDEGVVALLGMVEVGRGAKTLGDIPGKLLFLEFPGGAANGAAAGGDVTAGANAGGDVAAGAKKGVGVGDVEEAPDGCMGN